MLWKVTRSIRAARTSWIADSGCGFILIARLALSLSGASSNAAHGPDRNQSARHLRHRTGSIAGSRKLPSQIGRPPERNGSSSQCGCSPPTKKKTTYYIAY